MAVNQMELSQVMAATLSSDYHIRRQAEEKLTQAESAGGVLTSSLLQLVANGNEQLPVRLASSIYFKNFIKSHWPESPDENGGISEENRNLIKSHLVDLMLSVPAPLMAQLRESIKIISDLDFPAGWPTLLPTLVQRLTSSGDLNDGVQFGALETAATVFDKYRYLVRSNEVLRELQYILKEFQEVHLALYRQTMQEIFSPALKDASQATKASKLAKLLVVELEIFYDLNVVDIPEYYEDNSATWFEGFLRLLEWQDAPAALKAVDEDTPGAIENLKAQVCRNVALYADKYQEQVEPYICGVVKSVWTLLVSTSPNGSNDQLVSAGIKLLSSAASTKWDKSPFEEANSLQAICEHVVLPNIKLRDSDVEDFFDNPTEYIRRDMESADQDTRRRAAMELVKGLSKLYEQQVTDILVRYVQMLLQSVGSSSTEDAWRARDACVYLIIATAAKAQTRSKGVSIVNSAVDVPAFFEQQLMPELSQAIPSDREPSRAVFRASILKYIAVFRHHLPIEQLNRALPLVANHIQTPVTILPTVGPCLQILATDNTRSAYEMKLVMRKGCYLICYLCVELMTHILRAVAANPSDAVFNHYLFEAIASIVRTVLQFAPAQHGEVESALLPVISSILEQNVADFIPYCFQILGLLLDSGDSSTSAAGPQIYGALFDRLLTDSLWRTAANVPGLVRLFSSYFKKNAQFGEQITRNMQTILQRFQYVLNHRKIEMQAFDLIVSMFRYLPLAAYKDSLAGILTVFLTKLQKKNTAALTRKFAITLSVFVYCVPDGPKVLLTTLEQIQAGLSVMVVKSLWMSAFKGNMGGKENKKVCLLSAAKFVSDPTVQSNGEIMHAVLMGISELLGLNEREQQPGNSLLNPKLNDEDDDYEDDDAEDREYAVTFARLHSTEMPGHADYAPSVTDVPGSVKQALRGIDGRFLANPPQELARLSTWVRT
ncbi:Exportin-2, putative [Perkinsus marinus ATCC 50983]|uniref:Exportin-2, putative n=1 Tax=Perkinsus marinus (strain ATCC 50983 / TXsc) TaxID=423536 RepID=C5L8T9_PERM5|nr:Exportin-2, putative [Perkinsus marinus ATCC 50983]EER06797.1 Exportin-2, putative [Perkinsus marinus ATCC 50983]|eukprot:XP_002774981.1 Exportin-2, putative [Perkinsus marinus ATCC 50983]